MSRQIFEGHALANSYAAEQTKKYNRELFVVKCGASGSYGINYQIISDRSELRKGEKIVTHYKNGKIQ